MIVVLSGEGPSDIGSCKNQLGSCSIPEFNAGPMTLLINNLIDSEHGYNPLEVAPNIYRYYSESAIVEKADERKRQRRFALAGKKHAVETGFFYINAWMLGEIAKEIEEAENDLSISILFRDTDGTNSAPRNLWETKLNSIESGFRRAEYDRGVPMLPLPKSEAWLLCAIKDNPYQGCAALEELPGNDHSPNSAKDRLEGFLGKKASAVNICEWLENNKFDDISTAEQMPSFAAFRNRAVEVLKSVK